MLSLRTLGTKPSRAFEGLLGLLRRYVYCVGLCPCTLAAKRVLSIMRNSLKGKECAMLVLG